MNIGKTMPYWAGKTTLRWQDKEARQKRTGRARKGKGVKSGKSKKKCQMLRRDPSRPYPISLIFRLLPDQEHRTNFCKLGPPPEKI